MWWMPSPSSHSPTTASAKGRSTNHQQHPVGDSAATLRSSCVCGSLSLHIDGVTLQTPTVDCHCRTCRKYHTAAFAAFVQVPNTAVTWEGDTKAVYRDTCQHMGAVDRIYCSSCCTKLATTPATAVPNDNNNNDDDSNILINLGPMEDDTVPDAIWMDWQFQRKPWQWSERAVWPTAAAQWEDLEFSEYPSMRNVQGGCACGASRYQLRYQPPSELQHCYCRLCRQFSGSAYQTWIPIPEQFFTWTTPEPDFVKTTDHGGRHMCRSCGSVMTIVYDEDDGTVWPAAGGLDDETLPSTQEEMGNYLERVCHICCIWKQNWYKLPNDGNERIDKAG